MSPIWGAGGVNNAAGIAARQIRQELDRLGLPHARTVADIKLYVLYRKIAADPDVTPDQIAGVAADSLVKYPRPEWLEKLVGPWPQCFEFSNPADIAALGEWGHADTGQDKDAA